MSIEEVWVEKYKPTKIENVIGNEHLNNKFKGYIENKEIPTLLFSGYHGTGKTISAKILAKEISDDNILYINASSKTGIDTIRTRVEDFCSVQSMDALMKTVILDEADGLSPQAQNSLKNLIESVVETSRFILTSNHPERLTGPIKSRCQHFKFTKADKTEIGKRCMDIVLNKEKVLIEVSDDSKDKKKEIISGVKHIVSSVIACKYPDIRSCISTLSSLVYTKNGKRYLKEYSSVSDEMEIIIRFVKEKNITALRELIIKENLDMLDVYRTIFNNAKELSGSNFPLLYIKLAEYTYKHEVTTDQEINFAACMAEVIEICSME